MLQTSFLFYLQEFFAAFLHPGPPCSDLCGPLVHIKWDIPAHISDDWGVLQDDGYRVPSRHSEDKDVVTQMILFCSSYRICPCLCAYILSANSYGLTQLDVILV